jgi:hypothetical protein
MSSQQSSLQQKRLRRLEKIYGRLKQSLVGIGFIFPGSIVRRFMPCGKPSCRCATDVNKRHGPYYEWTRKLKGKTATVRLTAKQARHYENWIRNRRKLKKVLMRMQAVSIQAAQTQTTTTLRH